MNKLRMWLAFLLFLSCGARAAEVIVFAAASLSDSVKQIAGEYEKKSGDKIVFNFAASSTLARQIEEGAPADIFFSADDAKMDALEKSGRIDSATRKSRLSNSLAIVVSASSPLKIHSANDLTNAAVQRVAIADPRIVPAGVYAKSYLEKMKLWRAIEPKMITTENVRGALAAVESGNVEAGIVYKTDAAISKKVKVACEVPRDAGPDIRYPMAVLKEAEHPEAARKFLLFLDSETAAKIFKQFGFTVLN